MPKGLSLHIGLNGVNPQKYQDANGKPWAGKLVACEADANAMEKVAGSNGYITKKLLTEDATAENVLEGIGRAAQTLKSGDMFVLTFSGHGGQIDDVNGDEIDGLDETWGLYDRMLVDDELYRMWGEFDPGVRILMLSDSCHSGTMSKGGLFASVKENASLREAFEMDSEISFRIIPLEVMSATYLANKSLYNSIQWSSPRGDKTTVNASVLLISACQENQLAADGLTNGLFTKRLLTVLDAGDFKGGYYGLWKAIVKIMPATQTPNLYTVGASNPEFVAQKPFTI